MANDQEKQPPAPTVKEPLGVNGVPTAAPRQQVPPPPSDNDGLLDGATRPGAVAARAAPAAAAASQKSAAHAAATVPPQLPVPSFYATSYYPQGDPHRMALSTQQRLREQRNIEESARQALEAAQRRQWAAEAAQTAQTAPSAPGGNEEEEEEEGYEEHPLEAQARTGGMSGQCWQQWGDPELLALVNGGAFMYVKESAR